VATEKEQQEVVDTLKGPRYYRVQLSGYGGESAYISISKEAFNFWNEIVEEHGEDDLVEYMLNAEDGDLDFENVESVPESADFMKGSDGDYYPWFDHHDAIDHDHSVTYDCSYITIEEVDSDDFDGNVVNELVDREEVFDFAERISGEFKIADTDIVHYSEADEYPETEYIAQFYSIEKGCFFSGIIETIGEFDPTQIKIYVNEAINGEEVISDVTYKGKSIDNDGGCTNGKGATAAVYRNY